MIMIRDDPSHLLVGVPERDEHERSAAARSSTTVFKFASSECGAVRVLPSGRRRVRVRVRVCERTPAPGRSCAVQVLGMLTVTGLKRASWQ